MFSQVVRAASPVLLRVITLGAFFIYCTVSLYNIQYIYVLLLFFFESL